MIDGLFAPTPPLEASRYLISEAATIREGAKETDKVIMTNDVSRTFFEAPVKRIMCIELPEAECLEGEDDVGNLRVQSLWHKRRISDLPGGSAVGVCTK